jgi:hypothetical protein
MLYCKGCSGRVMMALGSPMRSSTNKCLFCLGETGPFTRDEHPIPESLGNDDLLLPLGFVCDSCNQYFGSKLEKQVLATPAFALERVNLNVPNKKGRTPSFSHRQHFAIHPTGFRDVVVLTGQQPVLDAALAGRIIPIPRAPDEDWLISRFLLKMGLELMILSDEIDPYEPQFDAARRFARAPSVAATWQYALGRYPRREDLIHHQTERDGETWIKEQLYQYSAGIMPSGEIGFAFLYRDHYFATNLNSPECEQYARQFDFLNEFRLNIFTGKHPNAA